MDERAIRISEMETLENHCQNHGIGNDNTEHPIRLYVKKRIRDIEEKFGVKPAASSPSPFIASTPTPAVTPAAPSGSFVAGK